MKYARVRNDKVIKIDSVQFPDSLPVNQGWVNPTDYPLSFYSQSAISYDVQQTEVIENKTFTLKTVDAIKIEFYEGQRQERIAFESVPIDYLSKKIDVSNEDNRSRIMTLQGKDKKLKVGVNDWLDLTTQEVKDLQGLVDDVTQTGFDTENTANKSVEVLTTHQELADYL